MPSSASSRLRTMVPIGIAAFVVLGLSESGIGTAWPSLRRSIDRPIEDLGTLLLVGPSGYAVASALSGALVRRLGTGSSVVIAAGLSLSGLSAYATAPGWIGVLLAAMLLGLGSGVLDSTINAHAAHHWTAGAMNLLHAAFGVGAALGPLVMALAITSSGGWQVGYIAYAVAQAVMLAVLLAMRRRWPATAADTAPAKGVRPVDGVLAASLVMFFLYTGIEVTAGQWSFSVLTERRGLSTGAGGLWVAAYWGGLTLGRLLLSAVADRLGPSRVLRISMIGSLATTCWFWWNPADLGLLGLPLLGLSLAGIFPTLVTLTPTRIGTERTTATVGYQLATASLGAALIPWVAGRLVAATSLAAVAPLLVATAIMMASLDAWLRRAGSVGLEDVADTAP